MILRKYIKSVPVKGLPKALSLGGQLGKVAGIVFTPLGIALTIYDGYSIIKDFVASPSDTFLKMLGKNVTTIGMYHEY